MILPDKNYVLFSLLISIVCVFPSRVGASKPSKSEIQNMFTVKSSDADYNSSMIGNGEIVTTVGPTGYHNGFCPVDEQVNRTIFWAGRRMSDARTAKIRNPRVPPEELIGATIPLVRFGRFRRNLRIDGIVTRDDSWTQTLNIDQGIIISELNHGDISEKTESLGLISSNYVELAERIPNYRLLTLPHAIQRSAGRGANFGWEVTETGEESAPYGHWVDEQFRHRIAFLLPVLPFDV